MNKEKILRCYEERRAWKEPEVVAMTDAMCFFKRGFPELEDQKIYALAERIMETRRNCTQAILPEEAYDAIGHTLALGLCNYEGYDVDPEEAYEFLMNCSNELFGYIVMYEAAENQGRYQIDYPEFEGKTSMASEFKDVLKRIRT